MKTHENLIKKEISLKISNILARNDVTPIAEKTKINPFFTNLVKKPLQLTKSAKQLLPLKTEKKKSWFFNRNLTPDPVRKNLADNFLKRQLTPTALKRPQILLTQKTAEKLTSSGKIEQKGADIKKFERLFEKSTLS